jgi:hypothetical protein
MLGQSNIGRIDYFAINFREKLKNLLGQFIDSIAIMESRRAQHLFVPKIFITV